MTDDPGEDAPPEDPLTYSKAGVDIDESEAATDALKAAIGAFDGEFAGLIDVGPIKLGLATDGVGTKLLVAEALGDYSTVGIDCIAMNANDLVAAGVEPVAFVDYLAVDAPDDSVATDIGTGLREGANLAGVELLGGETAVLPEVVTGLDLAGTCAGIAQEKELFPAEAQPGDSLVGFPSSGIHSNGLTLAREAIGRRFDYEDAFPGEKHETVGAALLEPTRIYTDLLPALRAVETHACAHITGGGWTNLSRMGAHHFEITDAFEPQRIFEEVQAAGQVSPVEMHTTFNMGTGFVVALPEAAAARLVERTQDGRIIGSVDTGEGVSIRGLRLDG